MLASAKASGRAQLSDFCVSAVEGALLPSLSLTEGNPGAAISAWSLLKQLPIPSRHRLYATWRGERPGAGPSSRMQAVVAAEHRAGRAARQVLKRVANDRKSTKLIGRQLAKIALCPEGA